MAEILDDNDEALILFYEDDKTPKTQKLLKSLEKIDLKAYPDLPFVRCSDTSEASAYGVKSGELPDVVLFFNGIPDEYDGNLLLNFVIYQMTILGFRITVSSE